MTVLELRFLGGIEIFLDDKSITALKSEKGKALLCYLAVTRVEHSRSALSGLLWTDLSEKNARANLRKTISRIKPYLGHFLKITRETIGFNQDALYRLDVAEFEASTSSGSDIHRLQESVSLYKGGFLEGFDLPGTLLFDEWVQTQRARLRGIAIDALQTLVMHFINSKEHDSGISYAKHLLAIEPWHEETHRNLMYMLASSGQRSAAIRQFEEARKLLKEQLDVEPSLSTVSLFEKIRADEFDPGAVLDAFGGVLSIASPSSSKLSKSPVSSIPLLATPLIGRQHELDKLNKYLGDPNVRLVTVTGMGGIGKTQLALALAHQIARSENFRDGVIFTPLSSIKSLPRLISAIAEQCNLSLAGSRQPENTLFVSLRNKSCLLILDNFEQLLPEVDFLTRLLHVATQIKFLVTSRERLKLREEWVLDLEGLSYPDTVQEMQTSNFDAIHLFNERARQIRSSFSLEEEKLSVVKICRLTQGTPLALEQAASLVRVSSTTEIADQIEARLDSLTTSLRNLPERHRSMRAVFDETWRWLSKEEQVVFCRLSVFRGGFTREAAEQVTGASLTNLTNLIDKSLLRLVPSLGGATRYELHDLVRQFATERLLEDGQEKVKRIRNYHLDFFLSLSESAEQFWDTEQEKEWLNRLETERGNLHAALSWATEQGKAEQSLRMNAALFTFWVYNSPAAEAVDLLGASLSTPCDEGSSEIMLARAKALNVAGYAALPISDFKLARGRFEEGARLYSALGDQRGYAWSLRGCGFVCLICGDLVEAQTFVEKSLIICQDIQDKWGSAWSSYDLGNITLAGAELESTESLLESALMQFCQLGNQFGNYRALISLGHLKRKQRKWAESKAHYSEALAIQSETQYLQFAAQILEGTGHIAVEDKNLETAVQLFGAAQARRDSIEMKRWAHQEIEYQKSLTLTKNQLPANDWQAAWGKGYAMMSQQGIDFAVASLEGL